MTLSGAPSSARGPPQAAPPQPSPYRGSPHVATPRELDNVVSLGVKPVGYAPSEGNDGIPTYLENAAGSRLRAADGYQELSKIAPTVFSIRPGFTWIDGGRGSGQKSGRPQAGRRGAGGR